MNRGTAFAAASLLRRAAATAGTGAASRSQALAKGSSMLSSATSLNASSMAIASAAAAAASRRACSSSSLSFSASRIVVVPTKQMNQSRSFVAAALSQAARLRGTTVEAMTTTTTKSAVATTTRRRRRPQQLSLSFSTSSLPHTAPPLLGPEAGIACGLSLSSSRSLSKWLAFCAAWTFSMVVLGGVTRLTRSGLSMTSWSFAGERPPMSAEGWEEEFENYKRHPEYKLVNRSMTLSEFKSIYWMEWAHRMWGRALGLAFVLPGCYFVFVKKSITPRLGKRLALLLAAGGGQGLVGWWMVRSGLTEPTLQSGLKEPRVAPTRLAAHLASATAIYCTLVYTSLQLAFPIAPAAFYAKNADAIAALRKARMVAHPLAGLVAVTALSGAFVAGLDAGRAYNTFPKMNGSWIPEEYPGLQGAFSDTAAAQLHHRALAATTLAATWAAWAVGRSPAGHLPRAAALALAALPAAATLQASLGVATLLTYVPPSLGSAHQAGALGLLTLALGLIFATRRPPRVLASATKRVMSGSGSGGSGVRSPLPAAAA